MLVGLDGVDGEDAVGVGVIEGVDGGRAPGGSVDGAAQERLGQVLNELADAIERIEFA